jgi:hypothetical protein
MTDRVLDGRFQLAVGHRVAVSYEQRIVAEPIVACWTDSEAASHLSETYVFCPIGKHQRHGTDKPRSPLCCWHVGQLAQQQCVVLLVAGSRARPTRGSHPWHLVEQVNRKA